MYFKIAFGNVKKSFKDYAIYFLTLTLAVSIFYSFNSIESQKAFANLQGNMNEIIKVLNTTISYISVFISLILGSLIVYANNFLIKKRKKELGIYMTLGMNKRKISKILLLETLIVGIVSLVLGLLLGIVESQGLSLFTAKLFNVEMSQYKFLLSIGAIGKTILYFGIMFFLIMIFNVSIISKYKIIDLIRADKKNEILKIKNPSVYLLTFALSILCIATAYICVLKSGLNIKDIRFALSIILGSIGTFLFFFSLCGLLLYIIKNNKKIYFKGINIFTIKQINSKIKTNFMSMSIICLMLFITIEVLSTGLSFKNAFESGLKETTPFDASGQMIVDKKDKIKNINNALNNIGFKFDNKDKYVYYTIYGDSSRISDVLNSNISKKHLEDLRKYPNCNVEVIKLSDYNNIRKLLNKKEVQINNDEVIITSNYNEFISAANERAKSDENITINGKGYKIKDKEIEKIQFTTNMVKDNFLTVIVTDENVEGLQVLQSNFIVNYGDENRAESEAKFNKLFREYKEGKYSYDEGSFINGDTKEELTTSTVGLTNIILFVVIYIGIIFLISSMTILALQQLSEASDSIDKYKALSKIGVSRSSIEKSIFNQILIYFSLPIVLALIHSAVGIKVANDFITLFNKPSIGSASMITAVMFLMLYIAYFYATYFSYKNVVKSSLNKK